MKQPTVTVGTQLRFGWDWPQSRWWLNNGSRWAEKAIHGHGGIVICPEVPTVISQLEIGTRAWRSLVKPSRSLKGS